MVEFSPDSLAQVNIDQLSSIESTFTSLSNTNVSIDKAFFAGLIQNTLLNLVDIGDFIEDIIGKLQEEFDICELINVLPLDEVEKIFKVALDLRNTAVDLLSRLQTILSSLAPIADILEILSTTFTIIINVIKLLAVPVSFPPGIGIPMNIPIILSDIIRFTELFIAQIASIAKSIDIIIQTISSTILPFIQILKAMEGQLYICAEELSEAQLAQDNNYINAVINNDPNVENLRSENYARLLANLSPINNDLSFDNNDLGGYKGFTFVIKPAQTIGEDVVQYYAVALDVRKIEVLRSEPSFASSPEVLVDQLKFIIDSQNLTGF